MLRFLPILLLRALSGDAATFDAILDAIDYVTPEPLERKILLAIAAHESGFRRDVATCKVRGDGGSALGPWQVHPRDALERKATCANVVTAASYALDRVRESLAACVRLPEPERLAAYASGSCDNRGGRRVSREMWPTW